METDTDAALEDVVFSMQSVPWLYNKDQQQVRLKLGGGQAHDRSSD
jgi:hypothetical protein